MIKHFDPNSTAVPGHAINVTRRRNKVVVYSAAEITVWGKVCTSTLSVYSKSPVPPPVYTGGYSIIAGISINTLPTSEDPPGGLGGEGR